MKHEKQPHSKIKAYSYLVAWFHVRVRICIHDKTHATKQRFSTGPFDVFF